MYEYIIANCAVWIIRRLRGFRTDSPPRTVPHGQYPFVLTGPNLKEMFYFLM